MNIFVNPPSAFSYIFWFYIVQGIPWPILFFNIPYWECMGITTLSKRMQGGQKKSCFRRFFGSHHPDYTWCWKCNEEILNPHVQLHWIVHTNSSVLNQHWGTSVAVNRGHDTCFGNGLVMSYADCKYLTFWLKHQSSCNRKLGPLSDTLQVVDRPTSKKRLASLQFLPTGQKWVVLWLLFFRSVPSTFPQETGYLLGAISGSP